MKISFIPTKTNPILHSMLIGNTVLMTDVMVMPEKCVDHRGLNLYLFAKQYGLDTKDIEINDDDGNIMRGYDYMKNPIYVKQAMRDFRNRL